MNGSAGLRIRINTIKGMSLYRKNTPPDLELFLKKKKRFHYAHLTQI